MDLNNLRFVKTFDITGRTIYTNFEGLNNLTQIGNSLSLNYISNITSFEGLTNLNYINRVSIMYSNLTSLDELNTIDSITSISVQFSDKLENIHLENLTNNYSLNIHDNRTLEYININNADKHANNIRITNNLQLWSLTGFENLENVGSDRGGLTLYNTPSLSNLDAFNSISYIKYLKITNSQVANLTFNSLTTIEDSLVLKNNPNLSDCSIDPVCHKALNDNKVIIENNIGNCETIQEVKGHCMTISNKNTILNKGINIYPNPTEGILYFDGKDLEWDAMVEIVDLNGKLVMQNQLNRFRQVILHQLNSGIYFVYVIQKNGRFSGKVVVE